MWNHYHSVTSIAEAVQLLAEHGAGARIVAGGTDLLLELERGARKGIDTLIDISRLPGLDEIYIDEAEIIHIGPLATHNHCVASRLAVERLFPLAQAAWEVGAPQIRNRGTVAGNLITASPANDTIAPLMALGASVRLASARGERVVPLDQFFSGVRRTAMAADEILVEIIVPAMSVRQRGMFIKLGLRRAQAISVVNAAVVLSLEDDWQASAQPRRIVDAAITLGSVAPTVIHAEQAEAFLRGRTLEKDSIAQAAELALQAARPIDDIRSSADYRREMARVCVSRCLSALADGKERQGFPKQPVLLWGDRKNDGQVQLAESLVHRQGSPIVTRINGKSYTFTAGQNQTLLHLIRDQAGLTGTKEGCGEGECGACTVFLDGKAVMSCLVPAPRAHGAEIVTIEGVAGETNFGETNLAEPRFAETSFAEGLHPVQRAFIEEGAVQCGYCTPGFIMSAVKLLEERSQPDVETIKQAITGNLCRCTGYYRIVQAIEKASQQMEASHG